MPAPHHSVFYRLPPNKQRQSTNVYQIMYYIVQNHILQHEIRTSAAMETISRSMTSINTSFARCSCTNIDITCIHIHTHTHPFNGPMSGTTRVSRYQKGKTSLDFTGARDSEWQWHQLGHMQVCISLQTDNHASTAPLSFLQTRCPSCRPTNSVKALEA